jgi:hypothetical protein
MRGVLLVAFLLTLGCASEQERSHTVKEEIRTALADGYLPRLARIYGGEEPSILDGWAAEKEISGIAKRVEELDLQGRRLEPALREVTLEEVNVWSHSNAYVTTLEVWDLRVYNTGTHALLSESIGKRDRVKYQLKRADGGDWIVLFRQLVE